MELANGQLFNAHGLHAIVQDVRADHKTQTLLAASERLHADSAKLTPLLPELSRAASILLLEDDISSMEEEPGVGDKVARKIRRNERRQSSKPTKSHNYLPAHPRSPKQQSPVVMKGKVISGARKEKKDSPEELQLREATEVSAGEPVELEAVCIKYPDNKESLTDARLAAPCIS